MPSPQLEANIKAICTQAPLKVPRKWSNIKSISIKTTSSVALPVYNKTLEELEEIRALAGTDADVVNAEKTVDEKAEKLDKEKKRKELAEKSPLARAIKKQKSVKKESADVETTKTSKEKRVKCNDSEDAKTKSSKKHKDKKIDESISDVLDTTTDKAPMLKTTKEKKVAKKDSNDVKTKSSEKSTNKELVDVDDAPKTPEGKKARTIDTDGVKSKSSKKRKDKQTDNTDDKMQSSSKKAKESNAHGAPFIESKKYQGSKKGYVFRKDKSGIGYYLDVLPVVDKEWLASLKRGSGKGGGRKSMSHTPNKRKGKSRISY